MTGPGPRLVLDAEGRTEYTPTHKVSWNGVSNPAELKLDGDDTVIVRVTRWDQMQSVAQWIQSGNHPFASLAIDSLTEVQKQLISSTVGADDRNPKIDEWGSILRKGETMLRFYRDVLRSEGQPLQVVLVLSGTEDTPGGRKVPFLQGSLAKSVSYPFDVVGYLYGTGGGGPPTLRIGPLDGFECGDGTNLLTQHYGPSITNPNLTDMMAVLNEEEMASA